VTKPVLELDVHAFPELLDVERRARPVDADLLARVSRLLRGEALTCAHGVPLKRSARCLIPRSIFRSITREAGSIGSMPRRATAVGSRNRLRLISRVVSL